MFQIFEFLSQFVYRDRYSLCDDFVDRLNRKYTVILLLVFVTILSSKQYIGEPLACFAPAHFTGAHVEYTNNICWISKAFYVPIETSFTWSSTTPPKYIADEFQYKFLNTSHMKFARVDNLIAYYPFLLIAQAILFYVPYFFWKNILNRSAYDISTLVYIAHDSQYSETQIQREKTLRYLIRHLDRANEYYKARTKIKAYKLEKHNSTSKCTFSPSSAVSSSKSSSSHNQQLQKKDGMTSKKLKKKHDQSSFTKIFKNIRQRFSNENIFDDINDEKYFDTEAQNFVHPETNISHEQKSTGRKSYNNMSQSVDITEPNKPFKFHSKIIFTVYLIKKILYIINCFCQFLLLNKFIAGESKSTKFYNENNEFVRSDTTFLTNKSMWRGFEFGYRSIANLIENGNLFGDKARLLIFHTVVFCDFRIRMLGDRLHRHTVQCVVPVNIFTEKIFTVLWFWLLILNFINVYNFLKWTVYYFSFKTRINFIIRHLLKSNEENVNPYPSKISTSDPSWSASSRKVFNYHKQNEIGFNLLFMNVKNEFNTKFIDSLTESYLMHDNIFILKLIAENTNEMITRELITLLLENFKRKRLLYDENTV